MLEIQRAGQFKVRQEIILRNTDGDPFLILCFKVHAFLMYVRITEGGPIILGFRFTQNSYFGTSYREGTISSYTAFSDPLKNFIMVLRRVDHFLY